MSPRKEAKYVLFICSDGYTTSLDLKGLLKDNLLLAYKLNDRYLEVPLGGSMRMLVPDKYAYKSAVWVERMTFAKRKEPRYWEKIGYSDTAGVWKKDRFTNRKSVIAH